MLDTIRNRLLHLALELERENPDAGEAPVGTGPVPRTKVENIAQQIVVQGGQHTFGTGPITQHIANITAGPAWAEVRRELFGIGLGQADVQELQAALDEDAADVATGQIGPATSGCASRAAERDKEIGTSVSTEVITGLILKLLNTG